MQRQITIGLKLAQFEWSGHKVNLLDTPGYLDFFGEVSMMVLHPATATVVARTPVRAYVMSHLQFLEVRVHESVMMQLRSAIGDRLSADRKLV